MSKNRKGYIAILTNPMFKENWTKIVRYKNRTELAEIIRSVSACYPRRFSAEKHILTEGNPDEIWERFCRRYHQKSGDFFNLSVEEALNGIEKLIYGKRSPFRFSKVGIGAGEYVIFDPLHIAVCVAGDAKVEYNGNPYSLSGFAKKFMPTDLRTNSGKYRGPEFFSYRGEKLTDLRDRIEFGE